MEQHLFNKTPFHSEAVDHKEYMKKIVKKGKPTKSVKSVKKSEQVEKKEFYIHKGFTPMVIRKAMSTEQLIDRMKKVK